MFQWLFSVPLIWNDGARPARPGAWFVAIIKLANPGLGQGRDVLNLIY